MEARRYLELARREDESARDARKRSEAAERFALRQVDEGLREHFLRLARLAEMDSRTHATRARRFEEMGAKNRERTTERAMSEAKVELVKQVLAACLRYDFDVPHEHVAGRSPDPRSTAVP